MPALQATIMTGQMIIMMMMTIYCHHHHESDEDTAAKVVYEIRSGNNKVTVKTWTKL
jgi:hypothetical protein